MAQLVAGFGTSESPQLHVPPEMWPDMGEADKRSVLLAPDGKVHTYEELLQQVAPQVAKALAPAEQQARHKKCQEDLASVGERLSEANLDALVVFATLGARVYHEGNTPSIFLYAGAEMPYIPAPVPADASAVAKAAAWGWGLQSLRLPGAAELGEHIIEHLTDHDFTISYSTALPEGKSIGAYFGFIEARLLKGKRMPALVPVLFNTGNSLNVPSLRRVFDLGVAIGDAIRSWESSARVGVLAIGGLSHTVIDEEMDRRMLKALEDKASETLRTLPKERFAHGNSQTRNWLAAAGAAQHLAFHLIDYIPCYRSPGGTGCGMAFAYWA